MAEEVPEWVWRLIESVATITETVVNLSIRMDHLEAGQSRPLDSSQLSTSMLIPPNVTPTVNQCALTFEEALDPKTS